jgi:N-acetylmuramoyl-L-alanine amidase
MLLCRRAVLRHAMAAGFISSVAPLTATAAGKKPHPRHRRKASSRPKPVVVIDPGHGGKDSGCIGLNGTFEKKVVLSLGLRFRRALHATGRYHVVMTRETDVFVPLVERVKFARKHRADLFISLHANASSSQKVRGACVYRFAYRASDSQARALARWENSADSLGGPAFENASPSLTHILASLMRRETWRHSSQLQHCMVEGLDDKARMLSVAARHARFVVLSAPDIASVLVETGFLTNPAEEKLLGSSSHQAALALCMRHAVDRYFAALGPGATSRRRG